jgi:hypothetical protein
VCTRPIESLFAGSSVIVLENSDPNVASRVHLPISNDFIASEPAHAVWDSIEKRMASREGQKSCSEDGSRFLWGLLNAASYLFVSEEEWCRRIDSAHCLNITLPVHSAPEKHMLKAIRGKPPEPLIRFILSTAEHEQQA